MAVNLCTNGDFETNANGWAAFGATTFARSTLQSHAGTASLEVTHNASLQNGAQFAYVPGGTVPRVNHVFSTWALAPAGRNLQLDINEFGGAQGAQGGAGSLISATGAWQSLTFTYVPVQTDRTSLTIYVTLNTAVAGDLTYWDEVTLYDSKTGAGHGDSTFSVLGPDVDIYARTGKGEAG